MTDLQGDNLKIEERKGFLYVEYSGDPLTLDMIVNTVNTVAQALHSTGQKLVLLVRNSPLLTSDANRALTAQLINNSGVGDVKFAIVDKFGNDPKKTSRAVESSRKAGWDLTEFNTIEEAERWLTTV